VGVEKTNGESGDGKVPVEACVSSLYMPSPRE
jgi:hypothetical protein